MTDPAENPVMVPPSDDPLWEIVETFEDSRPAGLAWERHLSDAKREDVDKNRREDFDKCPDMDSFIRTIEFLHSTTTDRKMT